MDTQSDTVEREIAAIWADSLGVERVQRTDNFFELGGDSVMVTIMTLQVEQALETMLNVDIVFDHPTLGEFVASVKASMADDI